MDLENIDIGFIQLHRQMMDKSWYSDSQYFHLWVHLVLSANHKPRFVDGIEIRRGQVKTGRKQLSRILGINESKIERILTYFEESEQQIEQQKTNKFRIITIKNYDRFQNVNSKVNNTEQQSNNRATTENTNNNDKHVNNDKNIYNNNFSSNSKIILKYFNESLNRNYRDPKFLYLIDDLLNKGYSMDQLYVVIKYRIWQSDKFDGWPSNNEIGYPKNQITPLTIFNPAKFDIAFNEALEYVDKPEEIKV